MRAKLQIFINAAAAGAAIVLVLLTIAAVTSSATTAVIACVIGILGLAAGCFMAPRVAERWAESADRLATRTKNLETRTMVLAERAEASDAQLSAAEEHSVALEGRVTDLEANATDLGQRAEILESATAFIEASGQLNEPVEYHDEQIGRLSRRNGESSVTFKKASTVTGTQLAATMADLERLIAAHEAVAQQVQRTRRDVQTLRARVPSGFLEPIEKQLKDLRISSREALRSAFESAIQQGRNPREVISERTAHRLFKDYMDREDFLRLRPLIENFEVLDKQSLTTLRGVYRFFRSTGYWDLASIVVAQVHAKSGRENDALAVAKIDHEIALFANPAMLRPELPEGDGYDPTGPILHMVGRALPDTQTGYTLRTQYTALAQSRKGLPVAIVGQAGITARKFETVEHYEHQGIDYYLLPGPARNTMLIDEWLARNILEFGVLVRELRPSILHAQSDFFNALIIDVVGKKYGIPTVYESRGFWEESWLSRAITANGWDGQAETLFSMYGVPAAYELRKHAEEVARLQPDHVFTLAEVMRDHILESAYGQIDEDRVSIVPNAVESANFPVQESDAELASEIGLPEDAIVVGYISSIVEYEGIDTLIDAYQLASTLTDRQLCLLLVGDGDYLGTLQRHVESKGIENVHFTGRVPHERVLDYYGLIDIFVVPRKSSTVADLVTPLKPFEAFSTGRAVILSDVGALKEIARQSDAVETFPAGDPEFLAYLIIELAKDATRRIDLGQRAARWVRNHRSWDGNVNEYYRVYRKLGFEGPRNPVVEAELDLAERGANAGEIVDGLRVTGVPHLTGWFSLEEMRQTASDILQVGWKYKAFEPVPVADDVDWSGYGQENRTWGFNLHTLAYLAPLMREYDADGDSYWLRSAIDIALKWVDDHRDPDATDDPMAWYDMALALRTPILIALTVRAARHGEFRDETVILAQALALHMAELERERAFNPNNNHGFYTAVAQLDLAHHLPWYPGASHTLHQGTVRLEKMAKSQFAPDGVHLEHSPDYHRMLLGSFERAVSGGLITDEDIKNRVLQAAHVLGWMVQPDGNLVQFGDSPEKQMATKGARSLDPETRFIVSNGRAGTPPKERLAVFREGGYAFVRAPRPEVGEDLARAGYLAFSASFHSRAHKHADDLNVVWFDRGQQILADSGRFGYGDLLPAGSPLRREGFYYSAPERQYVEGTMAHNTLMMDGRDQDRRERKPYGSALGDCAESDGAFDLSARVHHADYIHRRRIVYQPGESLLLKDSVFSQSTDRREAILWLNIPGHFELDSVSEDIVFVSGDGENRTRLSIAGPGRVIDPVRGQTSPLRGWRSRRDRSLEPTWSIGFAFEVETRASVETLLQLS